MSSLTKVNCYLNVYLKESIFSFIEQDTWLINKNMLIPLFHVKMYRILYKLSSDKIMSQINVIREINIMRTLMKYTEQFVCLKAMHKWLQCICNQCRLFIVYAKNTELTQFSHTLYSFYNELYEKLSILKKNQYLNTKLTL